MDVIERVIHGDGTDLHTSQSLKAQDGEFENYHYQLEDGQRYQLASDELGWLDFVDGRYAIAAHINENMDEHGVYTVDVMGMSKALVDDGIDHKAVCLHDDAALQSIFFYSSIGDIGD